MVERILERKVFFLGAWKTGKLSERLISDISVHADRFQGSPARLQLTKLGFKLYVKSGSGSVESTDFIPVQNIQELSVNKYKPTCLMCVMRDGTKGMSILAWKCLSERDSFEVIKGFTFLKRSLSGEAEGYNVLLRKSHGNNWSLGRKEGTRIGRTSSSDAEDPYTSIKATKEVTEGRTLVKHVIAGQIIVSDKAVQTEIDEDGHSTSVSIDSLSVKDELSNLTDEVNAIKDMLENVMGVSSATYYKKEITQKQNGHDVTLHAVEPTITRGTFVRANSHTENGDTMTNHLNGDHVDGELEDDYELRSYGIQTEIKRSSDRRYNRESTESQSNVPMSGPHANYLRASTSSSNQGERSRMGSDTSATSDAVFMQYRSPYTYDDQNRGGKLITFITPPPERISRTSERRFTKREEQRMSQKQASLPRNSGYPDYRLTIPRSIENVYPVNRRFIKRGDRRSRQSVDAYTFVRDDGKRKRSSSAHDTDRKRLDDATFQRHVRRPSLE